MSNKFESNPLLSRTGPKKRFDKHTSGTVTVVDVFVVELNVLDVVVVAEVVVVEVEQLPSMK